MIFGSVSAEEMSLSPWERVADVYEPQHFDFESILPDLSLDILDNCDFGQTLVAPSASAGSSSSFVAKPVSNDGHLSDSSNSVKICQAEGVEEALSVTVLIRADSWGNVMRVSGDLKKIGLKRKNLLATNIFNLIDLRNPLICSLLTSNCDVFMTDYSRTGKHGTVFAKSLVTITRCKETRVILSYEILERYQSIVKTNIETLKQRAQGLKHLVELSGDVLCQIDENGSHTYISPSAEAAWGYTHEELSKKTIWETVEMNELSKVSNELLGKPFSRFLLTRVTRSGARRVEEVCSRRQGNRINMICREWKDVSESISLISASSSSSSTKSTHSNFFNAKPIKSAPVQENLDFGHISSDSSTGCSSDSELSGGEFMSSPSPSSPVSPPPTSLPLKKTPSCSLAPRPKELVFIPVKMNNKVTKPKAKNSKSEKSKKFQLMTSILS